MKQFGVPVASPELFPAGSYVRLLGRTYRVAAVDEDVLRLRRVRTMWLRRLWRRARRTAESVAERSVRLLTA